MLVLLSSPDGVSADKVHFHWSIQQVELSLQTALANDQCLHFLEYPHLSSRVMEGDSVLMPPGLGLSFPGFEL